LTRRESSGSRGTRADQGVRPTKYRLPGKLPHVILCLIAVSAAAADGPLPQTRKSITQGKQVYLTNCVECHDQDGKGLNRRDFAGTPPADLTDPDQWLHGTSAEAIFSSIREGTKEDMPPFKGKLRDDQIWVIVNFVRSLWPEAKRPKLEEER
jgi:cbb3-type cytochrome c oxidase subunit III